MVVNLDPKKMLSLELFTVKSTSDSSFCFAAVDVALWAELARLKLDVQRLDDAPLPLAAHFAPGQGGDAAGRGAAGPALQVRRRFRVACGSCARSAASA